MKKGIRNITLITCCIDIGHFSVRLYMVVWALQFSVSNALSADMLGSSSRMSNIYIYIYCLGEFNTYFNNHGSHNSSATRFLGSSSSSFVLSI